MPAALGRNTDVDFPVIAAACQRQSARMVGATPVASTGG